MFSLLISVDGVGQKQVIPLCVHLGLEIFGITIWNQMWCFFQKIKGIGKKTAQRILVDISEQWDRI